MHSVGCGEYEYIRKIYYYVVAGKEDLFLCEMETNDHSMIFIFNLIRVLLCVPRINDEYSFFLMCRNFVLREN